MKTAFTSKQSWLIWFSRGLLLLILLILLSRLFELQIIKGSYFRDLSEGNRIRRVSINAPRGKILARGGEVLASNKDVKKTVEFDSREGYRKILLDKEIPAEETIIESLRDYPMGAGFAHLGGYVGEVSEEELNKIDPQCSQKGVRKLGQFIGKSGLELKYDCILSGIDGEILYEVDTSGKIVRPLGKRDPIPGGDIKTNIDYNLQKKVSELMMEKIGGVVITDPEGQVLALYSSPSFDPNLMLGGTKSQLEDLYNNPDLPFFNRVISGLYHPGSVFKPLVAIAGLEEELIDDDFKYNDQGQIVLKTLYGTYTYNNWYFTQYGGREGEIDLIKALARSTDTFFYNLGELLGVDKLAGWSKKFGLDKETGIDLEGESPGLVPDEVWKFAVKGERWFLGNTYHMSIGQGDLALTPILVNHLTSVFASGGKSCSPTIVGKSGCYELGLAKANIDLVVEGMRGACESGGTGYTFFDADPKVACKTGTAEINEDDTTHAWFTFFSPVENPEIITTVLIEKGGEGSKVAGPVARDIYNFWKENKNSF